MSLAAEPLKAPFPYFGGKSRAAELLWERFGDTPNYVEPFAGSLAVLLARPHAPRIETVNDMDGLLVNFWRAVRAEPDAVAMHADWPVTELDLTARHAHLVERRADLTKSLEADPEHYDARLAGWWAWGACAWIGSGWCSGEGPWRVADGELRKLPHLGDAGTGINRQLPRLGDAGTGINRKLPHLGDAGTVEWLHRLARRLRRVRITTGDFARVLTPSVTTKHGITAVLLDPPYDHDGDRSMYADYDNTASARARQWAQENGHDPLFRIALCGYGAEHDNLLEHGWTREEWRARRGYQSIDEDGTHTGHQERIWFSPHCLTPETASPLFAEPIP